MDLGAVALQQLLDGHVLSVHEDGTVTLYSRHVEQLLRRRVVLPPAEAAAFLMGHGVCAEDAEAAAGTLSGESCALLWELASAKVDMHAFLQLLTTVGTKGKSRFFVCFKTKCVRFAFSFPYSLEDAGVDAGNAVLG